MATAGKREQTKTAAAGLNNITAGQNILGNTNKIAASEVNTNGGLSPLVSKQLANEQGMIGKTYQTASQAADRGLSQRGMGVAPSGLSASIKNTGINNAGTAQTGAVGGAFGTQNQLNNTAYNPSINAENAITGGVDASTKANTAESQIPSTFGNIMTGLSGLTGIATGLGPAASSVKSLIPQ